VLLCLFSPQGFTEEDLDKEFNLTGVASLAVRCLA